MRALRPLVVFGLASLLFATSAQAAYDPLASGQAKLTLDPSLRSLLKQSQIKLSGRKGARVAGQRTATLPVSGGEADPTIEKGSWELGGELVLQAKRKAVPLTFLTINAKPTPLYAKVGGGQQKVAKAKTRSFIREGFGYGYEAKGLKLSQKTATRLDKRLDTEAFQANQPLGSIRVASQPQTVTVLAQNRATLAFAPAFVSKLSSLFVSLNPVFPAEHQGPTFTFPIIAASAIAPDASQGTIRTGGEVELLQLGAGQVFWREQWLSPGEGVDLAEANLQPSPPFAGKLAQAPLFSLSLAGAQVVSDPTARTVGISNASLALQAATAAQLNQLFAQGKAVFAAGEAVGSLSLTAQGQ